MSEQDAIEKLNKTPLDALHRELGARMVPFAGYSMPVQYPAGIMKEHLHTRNRAGLFDVSHMGQVRLSGADAALALETLMPVDIVDLAANKQRYALFTNQNGGILDDLMVTNTGENLFVVVNAACKAQDISLLETLSDRCQVEALTERALLALQGPQAAKVLAKLTPAVNKLVFMTADHFEIAGADCFVSRSGYTGEDGFEISVPSAQAESLARELLALEGVAPVGLGARDSLRLEAGLCLYGNDIDETTTPVEASLLWALSKTRRSGGDREGGFPGAKVILQQIAEGVTRKRVGILSQGRIPVREGAELVTDNGEPVGKVTSGSFGPTFGGPVAMGYVLSEYSKADTELQAKVRNKLHPVKVAKTPFVPQRYYRG